MHRRWRRSSAWRAAHSNSVPVAAADRVGVDRGQLFIGQSVIVSHTGWPVAGPASPDSPEIIYAELDLATARTARAWNAFNNPIRDRRQESYLGAQADTHCIMHENGSSGRHHALIHAAFIR